MAETVVLAAETRKGRGTHKAAKLRKEGKLPAVIYGHKEATVQVSLNSEEFGKAIRHGVRVVDLKLDDGKVEKALIQEVQWDHLGIEVLHADFARVSEDERIEIDVRLELRGIAPGIAGGGVVDQPLHTLRVECLAVAVPESIRVMIDQLHVGHAIHVKDLKLPEGVKALDDPDAIVVHVITKTTEPVPGELPVSAAEPEIIGRAKPEGEEEAE